MCSLVRKQGFEHGRNQTPSPAQLGGHPEWSRCRHATSDAAHYRERGACLKDIVEWVVANAKERALAGSDQVPVAVEVSVPVASGEKISNLFLLGRMWDVDSNERSARECMGVLEVHREGNALRQTLYLAEILRHGGVV